MTESDGYAPPLGDIRNALEIAGLPGLLGLEAFGHIEAADVEMALREFGRLASEVIAPTDRPGDLAGSVFSAERDEVMAPAPFHPAYRHYVQAGWGSLQFPTKYGGGDFPAVVGLALQEMFASANLALSLNPVLTQGAVDLLLRWGSEEQRERYLPRMLTGEWSGTMALTEADAGSDLRRLATRAERDADGIWRITGSKVFISWGEHDLTSNIIHLVLARIPGGPPGSQGISAFLVPKFLLDREGQSGERNALRCTRVEDKLGIHASPTCAMAFEGAVGELVGEEHGGLRAMFTMMNAERLSIGLQGPAVAERAFQQAAAYAAERVQGHAGVSTAAPSDVRIIEHPDVRRMLLDMRTRVLAGRLLIYLAGACGDYARHLENAGQCATLQAKADLLTPVAKAWSTDAGVVAASLGIQVLGGAGFIEESGMAQRLRDSRVTTIYEGTNGIQAIDLVVRKIGRDGGRCMRALCDEIEETLADAPDRDGPLAVTFEVLAEALAVLRLATTWMLDHLASAPEDALAGATSYLELTGITIAGWLMLQRAMRAVDRGDAEGSAAEAEFFSSETVARAAGLLRPITSGAQRLRIVASSGG